MAKQGVLKTLDMDKHLLNPATGIIESTYLRKDLQDNHYDQQAFAELLCKLFNSPAFEIWLVK